MQPPKKAVDFLRWFCREDYIEEIEGDLTEIFRKEHKHSPRLSRWKFTLGVIRYLRPEFVKPMKNYDQQNSFGMYTSYFKIGWRNLIKNRSFSVINLIGLTVGFSICFTLLTIVNYELGFDKFHAGHSKIYRVLGEVTEPSGDKITFCRIPYSTVHLARQSTMVEMASTIIPLNTKVKIYDSNGSSKEFSSAMSGSHFITTAIVEPLYFQLFHYNWLAGNPSNALSSANSVVITESRAKLYFSELEPYQIVGKSIVYEDSLIVQVTGVVKDFEESSDLKFCDFLSNSSLDNKVLKKYISTEGWTQRDMNTWVFAKLSASGSKHNVENKLNDLLMKNKPEDLKLALSIEPITQMHFNSNIIENPIRTAHLPTLYTLIIIGVLILVLAIMNFVNLTIAIYLRHLKEAAVRKIIGSSRWHLVMRFLSESIIILLIALGFASAFIDPLLDIFKSYIPNGINHRWFRVENLLWSALVFIVVITLLAAVSFRMLASVPPAQGIKGVKTQSGGSQSLSQKILIIVQFTISVAFIIGTLVVERQIRFIRNKDLGFHTHAIVTLRAPQGEANRLKTFASAVSESSHVMNAALQWQSPIHENPRGMTLKTNSSTATEFSVTQIAGDENYIPLYGIKLLSGRNLTPTDTVNELVINETLMKKIGIQKSVDAPGKILYWNDKPYPIVGVVADFHTLNLHQPIEPLCIINRADRHGEIAIKLRGASISELRTALETVQEKWHIVFGSAQFEFRFLDDSIAQLYSKEEQTSTLMNIATAVAVLISCIGLFGLVAFMIEGRMKEIGIRKVLGASISGIVSLFLTDLVTLILISILIAAPVAYYFMDQWLNQFAYHVPLEWWLFILSSLLVILVAVMTVSFRTIKAAMANPINSLRSE